MLLISHSFFEQTAGFDAIDVFRNIMSLTKQINSINFLKTPRKTKWYIISFKPYDI